MTSVLKTNGSLHFIPASIGYILKLKFQYISNKI